MAAVPGHAAVRARLDWLLARAERALQGAEDGGDDAPPLDGPPRRVDLDARWLEVPVWRPGRGARARHRVDGSGLRRGFGKLF